MARRSDSEKDAEWRKRLERFTRSGLTVARFCDGERGSVCYIRNQWKPLQTYLSDGRVPLDNNEVEQLMKQVALGRKNWLFIGSVPAGQRAADFLTLVSSAWRNDLDVWAYLRDVLDRLLAGETDYAALRPDVWRREHPEAIREYRVTERRDRADRKQYRRAARRRNTPKSTH